MTASKTALPDPDREKRRQARKAQRHSERRLLIMRSAKDLLVAQGIENFTVAEVAQTSQLSKPAVYYYFDSKEALVFDLAIESLQIEFNVLAESVHVAKSGVEALIGLVRTRVDFFLAIWMRSRFSMCGRRPWVCSDNCLSPASASKSRHC